MPFSHKQRPPSKLFSWLTQWRRRSSTNSQNGQPSLARSNDSPLRSPTIVNEQPARPISVAGHQPSITSSVAGSIESFYTSSVPSSVFDDQNSTLSAVAASRPQGNRFSALEEMTTKHATQDDLFDRFGSGYPKQLKRTSLDSQREAPRPSSLFSLTIPDQKEKAAHIGKPWPRSDRMVMRQELLHLVLDGLFYSPLDMLPPRRILHIGCGNGTWCMEMANRYPHCFVVGMDDREFNRKALPRNLNFVRCHRTILQDLKAIPDHHYDFIYGRFLMFSFPSDIYREIIEECWRICRPGGYVEMMEFDMRIYGNPRVGPLTHALNCQVIRVMESRSLEPHFANHLQDLFFFHKLVEQQHQKPGDAYFAKYFSLPLGVWGGRLGVMFRDDVHDLIEEIQRSQLPSDARVSYGDDNDDEDIFYADSPWSDRQLDATLELMDDELEMHRAFMNLHCVYGHKL